MTTITNNHFHLQPVKTNNLGCSNRIQSMKEVVKVIGSSNT